MDYSSLPAGVIVLAGFIVLLVSGDLLVRSAVSFATHFRISTLVVGVTIVSFGTSLPELLVSLGAALKGHPDISVGNVVGSNISNIALVLGLTALLLPVPVSRTSAILDWPVMMFVSLVFYALIYKGVIGLLEGILFVTGLGLYIFWLVRQSRKSLLLPGIKVPAPKFALGTSLLIFLVASAGLWFGADLLVDGASELAKIWNVSERVISVSIIAFGTSVPELATSIVAAFKKEMDISVGNIIGSNIFNILGILGITAMVKPIQINPSILFDTYWMLAISFLLLVFMLPPGKGFIHRWKGLILLLMYVSYIALLYKT
jgi:cation:H+ antiporter